MWWVFIKSSVALALACILMRCDACATTKTQVPKIFLASSLAPVGDTIKELISDTPIDLVFQSSSAIAKQIEHGAPCELAILADENWQNYLLQRILVTTLDDALVTNSLVLASIEPLHGDFLTRAPANEQIIIADPDYVPLGAYTKEALDSLGVYHNLKTRFVLASSARQATIMLANKAARVAVLYRSDALNSKFRIVNELPTTSHRPIRYPLVQCASTREPQLRKLVRALRSASFKEKTIAMGFY